MDEDDLYFIVNEHLERKSAGLKKRFVKSKKKNKVFTTRDIDINSILEDGEKK